MTVGDRLRGMREIMQYEQRRADTILEWVQTRGYPAVMIDGIWESMRSAVDAWRREQISGGDGVQCRAALLRLWEAIDAGAEADDLLAIIEDVLGDGVPARRSGARRSTRARRKGGMK